MHGAPQWREHRERFPVFAYIQHGIVSKRTPRLYPPSVEDFILRADPGKARAVRSGSAEQPDLTRFPVTRLEFGQVAAFGRCDEVEHSIAAFGVELGIRVRRGSFLKTLRIPLFIKQARCAPARGARIATRAVRNSRRNSRAVRRPVKQPDRDTLFLRAIAYEREVRRFLYPFVHASVIDDIIREAYLLLQNYQSEKPVE